MMCRVIAPRAVHPIRDAVSRPPLPRPPEELPAGRLASLHRRLRILRHRAFRWFDDPIAVVERERKERGLDPSVWGYGFPPPPRR